MSLLTFIRTIDQRADHHPVCLQHIGSKQIALADTAAAFFSELLSPFEMSFRGYRAANEELQRLNELLRGQKEAVELANEELEAFSYSVSHDLRAPLRMVSAFTHAIVDDLGDKLGDKGRDHVRRVLAATSRM